MNSILLVIAVVVGSSALPMQQKQLVRTPAFDSAVVQSHRDGGNFAYSATEGHAYGIQTPAVYSQRVVPVGVAAYSQGSPIVKSSPSSFVQTPSVYSSGVAPYSAGVVPYSAGVVPSTFVYNNAPLNSHFRFSQFNPYEYSAFNPNLYAGFNPYLYAGFNPYNNLFSAPQIKFV